jgi:16S rRNA processing protein RimM
MEAIDKLIVGKINGIYGVQGWVKVYSHTDPIENIFSYQPWYLKCKDGQWREVEVLNHRVHMGGKALVAKLEGVDDREVARTLMGCEIAIDRGQLPPAEDGYYWVDLIGCDVIDQHGKHLGKVVDMIETGSHDVMRIKGDKDQHLIPLVEGHFVTRVDIPNKKIHVDWDSSEADN